MSAARILHFGNDACRRLEVMRQAGYDARVCRSQPELVQRLRQAELDAVLFPGIPAKPLRVDELRRQTNIPFVVFAPPLDVPHSVAFDLVVDPITSPDDWLRRLDQTIQIFREVREKAIAVQSRSAALLRELKDVRSQSAAARERRREMRDRVPVPAEYRSAYTNLMLDAQRAADALDRVTRRDDLKARSAAASAASRIHSQLLEYQRTAMMTRPEANSMQYAIDLLRARLKFFGEPV